MIPAEKVPFSRQPLFIYGFLATVTAVTLGIAAPFFIQYSLSFVHPHFLDPHMKIFAETEHFEWRDFLLPFVSYDSLEYRPRYLTYAVTLIDLKIRFWAYSHFVWPPALSIALPIQLLGIYALYRTVVNLTKDRVAAGLAVVVYVSSIGFLSAYTMYFTVGKPLCGPLFLFALWIMSSVDRSTPPTYLFHQLPIQAIVALALLMFAGFEVDEIAFFGLLVIPIIFAERFFGSPLGTLNISQAWPAWAIYLIPVASFLLFILLIVPIITQYFFNYKFDYLSTLLGYGRGAAGAESVLTGPFGGVTWRSIQTNFLTLFGLSSVPWQIAPLYSAPGTGGVLSSQTSNFAQLSILAVIFVVIGFLAFSSRGLPGQYFRRIVVVTILFVVFQSIVNGRHVPYVSGYYYGDAFSAFFALLMGSSFAALGCLRPSLRLTSIGAAFCIAMIQINNFYVLNDDLLRFHNERLIRPTYKALLPMADSSVEVTATELEFIRQAWIKRDLERYIAAHPVSTGAVYLVEQLRYLDRLRHADKLQRSSAPARQWMPPRHPRERPQTYIYRKSLALSS